MRARFKPDGGLVAVGHASSGRYEKFSHEAGVRRELHFNGPKLLDDLPSTPEEEKRFNNLRFTLSERSGNFRFTSKWWTVDNDGEETRWQTDAYPNHGVGAGVIRNARRTRVKLGRGLDDA